MVLKLISDLGLMVNNSGFDNETTTADVITAQDRNIEFKRFALDPYFHSLSVLKPGFTYLPQLTASAVKRYTDYGDARVWEENLNRITGALLRANNLESVASYLTFKIEVGVQVPAYDSFREAIVGLFLQPTILSDETYNQRFIKYVDNYKKDPDGNPSRDYRPKDEVSLFAEFVPEMRRFDLVRRASVAHFASILHYPNQRIVEHEIIDDELFCDIGLYLKRVTEIMIIMQTRMKDNAVRVQQDLTGIHWITQNPDRQWTSSNNPIMTNPREFYGDKYVPFSIGIPCEMETVLRLIRKHPQSSFWTLPGNIFNLLLIYLVRAYAFNIDLADEVVPFVCPPNTK